MITIQDLKEVLKKHKYSENQIERILHKRIKTLLNRGNKDNIDEILQILDKHNIEKETIEGCLSVLVQAKAKEIEGIFEVLDKHAEMLLQTAKIVAKNFAYAYKMKDVSELESQSMEIIIQKCGDIGFNLDWNPELLKRLIYTKTYNYLKMNLKTKEILIDFSDKKVERHYKAGNSTDNSDENLNLSKWNINQEQENILRYISMCLEEGKGLNEAIENVANILNMDEEEVLEEIENIKEQNNENKISMGEEDELS